MKHNAPPSHTCPRCGYDLAGAVAAWHPRGANADGATSPTRGTCSECGLRFAWKHVLDPASLGIDWFFEATPARRRGFPFGRTLLRAITPWRFWRDVLMEMPVDAGRLVMWCAWVLGLHICAIVLLILVNVVGSRLVPVPVGGLWQYYPWEQLRGVGMIAIPGLVQVTVLDQLWTQTWCVARGVVDLCRWWNAKGWLPALVSGLFSYPIMFMLLPWTRRLSKVRAAHVLRASVYATTPLVVVLAAPALMSCLQISESLPGNPMKLGLDIARHHPYFYDPWASASEKASPLLWMFVVGWFAVWWLGALRWGFRMQDWRPAWLAILVPSLILQCFVIIMAEASLA